MRLIISDRNLQTIEQVRQFLGGSEALEFRALSVGEKYNCIEEVLIRFRYHRLKRAEKGVIRRYMGKYYGLFSVTGVAANNTVRTKGTVKTDAISKASIPQEV